MKDDIPALLEGREFNGYVYHEVVREGVLECPKWGCEIPFEVYRVTLKENSLPTDRDAVEWRLQGIEQEDRAAKTAATNSTPLVLSECRLEKDHQHWVHILERFHAQKERRMPTESEIQPSSHSTHLVSDPASPKI